MALLARTDLTEFLSEEALVEAAFDPLLADMFSLSEDGEPQPHPAKAVRKDQRKMDRLKTMTAHIYAGVPSRVAAWGHEAHAEGLRAFGMERSDKASPRMKMKAHHEAHQAHQLAANKLRNAGHEEAASLHQRAANFHRDRKDALGQQHDIHVEARRVHGEAKGQDDPLPGPPKKSTKKPDNSMGFPKEESIQNWIAELDEEGKYNDEVKRASKLAANASAVTQEKHAGASHHETAARMHFIAKGVALAHGHKDLAAKHDEFVNKHRIAAKQALAAS